MKRSDYTVCICVLRDESICIRRFKLPDSALSGSGGVCDLNLRMFVRSQDLTAYWV